MTTASPNCSLHLDTASRLLADILNSDDRAHAQLTSLNSEMDNSTSSCPRSTDRQRPRIGPRIESRSDAVAGPPMPPHTYDLMTANRRNNSQPRSSLGRWNRKAQSAPETGPLICATPAEGAAERVFRLRKEGALIRGETAFLYATLGVPGSDVFDAFDRIGELAEAESLLETTV